MPPLQFAAQAYQARSLQLVAQQCINAFVETTPKGVEAKTPVPIYGTPGLSVFSRQGRGPINGLWIMGDFLYVLSGAALYQVNDQGQATLIGQTNLGGICSMADNGQQLVMVDGFGGWIYQPGGLNQVTTETVSPFNSLPITVGGTATTSDVLHLQFTSANVSGSPATVSYTVAGGDTTATIAQGLAAAVEANSALRVSGIGAVPQGSAVTITWPTTINVAVLPSTSSGATETLTAGALVLVGPTTIPANITGTITSGDTLNIPLDNGAIFTTTAAATVTAADSAIILTTGAPSQVSAGAIITDPANTLAQILAEAFHAADTVTYMDGYFVFNAAGTRQFFISGINDGTQYSGLDFATATANTGFCLNVSNFHEQLLIFTSKASTEVWYDSGAVNFPFQRYDGVYIQRGLSNPLAVCSEDNTLFWMGDDGIFYRNEGFLPKRISTFAMEHAWANYPARFRDCNCFVLNQEGHKFAVLQFPSGEQTWVFDLSTNLWHQRESFGSPWV